MTGRNPMEVMWNPEMTRRVHNTLRWMTIAAMKWTLLIIVFIGKEKKWGKVKHSIQIRCRWQNILTKVSGIIGQVGKPLRPSEHGTVSLQIKF